MDVLQSPDGAGDRAGRLGQVRRLRPLRLQTTLQHVGLDNRVGPGRHRIVNKCQSELLIDNDIAKVANIEAETVLYRSLRLFPIDRYVRLPEPDFKDTPDRSSVASPLECGINKRTNRDDDGVGHFFHDLT